MSIEMLEKFATDSGNEEVLKAVNTVKDSYKSNVDRLSFLEKEMKQATEKRDSVKNLVKSKFGIEEVSEEALDGVVSKLNSGQNDGDIKNLSSMVEMLKVEKESIETKYAETINSFKVERELNSIGAREDTEGSRAYDIILSEIKKGAEFDTEGNLVFKSNDGTTIRNSDGSPTTLADRYNQLKDSDELAFLFKKKRSKAGSGSSGGASTGGKVTSLKDLSEAERIRLFKQDPESYRRLANL